MHNIFLLKATLAMILIGAETSWISSGSKNPYNVLNNSEQHSYKFKDTVVENKILERLFNLPEVKLSDHFIDSITNHRHGISMRIVHRPD